MSGAAGADPFRTYIARTPPAREPTIGVGRKRIVQVSNFRIAVYNRSPLGQELWYQCLDPFEATDLCWDTVPEPDRCSCYFWDVSPTSGEFIFDPRVVYDPFSGRFVVIALQNNRQSVFLAISKDETPDSPDSDEWDKFYLDARVDGAIGSGDNNIDWPGLAVTPERILLTTLLWTNSGRRHCLQILKKPPPGATDFFEQAGNHRRLIIPVSPTPTSLEGWRITLPMPAHFVEDSGSATAYLAQLTTLGRVADPDADPPDPGESARFRLLAVTFDVSGAPTLHEHTALPTDDVPPDASLDYARQLCPALVRIQQKQNVQNCVWRGGKLYYSRIEERLDDDVPASGVSRFVGRWYVDALNDWPAINTPTRLETGLIDAGRHFIDDEDKSDGHANVLYPLVMPCANGDVALFLTRTNPFGYVDLCWTARRASDPLGITAAPVTVMRAGTAGVAAPYRWGDFEGIALDPLDANRPWGAGQTGECSEQSPCSACDPMDPSAGVSQEFHHIWVGSYTVPQQAPKTLTIERPIFGAPDVIDVKVMPPDVYNNAYFSLTAGAPVVVRTYGHGTTVTLRAKEIPGWLFTGWLQPLGGAGPDAPGRDTVVVTDQDQVLIPTYQQCP